VPFANEVDVMLSPLGLMVMEKFAVDVVPTLSVTASVNGKTPGLVGVPPRVTPETLRPGARPVEALQL
jgi:hypothetical protein